MNLMESRREAHEIVQLYYERYIKFLEDFGVVARSSIPGWSIGWNLWKKWREELLFLLETLLPSYINFDTALSTVPNFWKFDMVWQSKISG